MWAEDPTSTTPELKSNASREVVTEAPDQFAGILDGMLTAKSADGRPFPPRGGTETGTASLADQAYERLRDAIVRGEFRPNERLIEADLADWLSVSRTPMREALARLASDGLVVSWRRGWRVHEHTTDEVREIYETRAALEGMATFLAASRRTSEQLERIVSLHLEEDPDDEIEPAPRAHLVEINDSFHDAIVEAAGNERLRLLVRRSREFFFNYRIAAVYTDEEAISSLRGHEAIVEAISAVHPEAAEQAMRKHVFEALEATLAKLT